jgi:hypothetical protein
MSTHLEYTIIKKTGDLATRMIQANNKANFEDLEMSSNYLEVVQFKEGLQNKRVSVYCRSNGKESEINKYDFLPPPIDRDLYYGSIFIVKYDKKTKEIENFNVNECKNYFKYLHKNFENIEESEERSTNGSDSYSDLRGFVVGDDEDDRSVSEYSDSSNKI